MMSKKQLIPVAVAIVVVAGVSFWGGVTYAKTNMPRGAFVGQFGAGMPGGTGRTGSARGGMMGGATIGQIVSANGSSISVHLSNNSTQLVLLNASTQIAKSVAGTATDLTAGINVLVTGKSNSDGSITADMIQIRPATSTRAY